MILNLPKIKRYVHRLRVGHNMAIHLLAARKWTLHPEEHVILPPALHLDGAIEKIRALSPYRTWQQEMPLIAGGRVRLPPSRAYEIHNVNVAGPSLYAGPAVRKIGFGPDRLLRSEVTPSQDIAHANLVSTWSGTHFFGTHCLDDLPLELIAENSADNIALQSKTYGHMTGYRALFDLPAPHVVTDASIRRLVLYREPAQNASKASRYRTLRARLRAKFTPPSVTASPGMYLRRGGDGEQRILENEAEVETALERLGFDIVDTKGLTAAEIAARTFNAKHVVSVEGSHASHTMFSMADDGAMLVIEPPDRFALQYKDFTDAVGMRYAFAVAEPSRKGFTMPVDELLRTLDLLT